MSKQASTWLRIPAYDSPVVPDANVPAVSWLPAAPRGMENSRNYSFLGFQLRYVLM